MSTRITVRLPDGLADDLDDLCASLHLTRSELLRDLIEEALPTLGPVMTLVQTYKEENRDDPKWFLDAYKGLLMKRVRVLERR